jgi:acyl dehydratase
MGDQALIRGKITELDLELLKKRIGFPNPTLRTGLRTKPWNPVVEQEAIRRWAVSIGDDNPLYVEPEHARASRWGAPVAPPGFEWSMGWDRSPIVTKEMHEETHRALRGVQLYHSGAEYFYYKPLLQGTELYRSEWLADAVEKESRFANRTVITTNRNCYWDSDEQVHVTSSRWFVHAERRAISEEEKQKKADGEGKGPRYEAPYYTEEQMAEIEAAYDAQFLRSDQPLWFEDAKIGDATPTMVKGPLTVSDIINMYMGSGWITYTNPPFRLAYENRKRLRGFYSRDEFGAWDSVQRVHWDKELARSVGVPSIYDIGPMRFVMLCHYLTNFAGDDGFVHRLRYELRNFNYVGDTTWISGRITDVRVDEVLGPLVELEVSAINQRGQENMKGSATILVPSRAHGPVRMPASPPVTPHRMDKPSRPGL